MDMTEFLMNHPHDHIMANTWRLIFERRSEAAKTNPPLPAPTDFCLLEQLLPEYRLIGLSLADKNRKYGALD